MNAINIEMKTFGTTFEVKEPTSGELMLIEAKKSAFSNGAYGLMVQSNSLNSNLVLDLIDAIAYFSVLIPELKQYLSGQDYNKMTMNESLAIVIAYRKHFWPWWEKITEEMHDEYKQLIKELTEKDTTVETA